MGMVRPGAREPSDSTAKGTQDPRPLPKAGRGDAAAGMAAPGPEDIGRQGLVPGDTTGEGEKALVCAEAHCLEQCLAQSKCSITVST